MANNEETEEYHGNEAISKSNSMVEPFTKRFRAMTAFDKIPNKQLVSKIAKKPNLWPELGNNFELNQFYKLYSCSEGWFGESYFAIWTQQEIISFRNSISETYSEKFHFFASDGGGTQFGFVIEDPSAIFVSAPNIGNEGDIRKLELWGHFLNSIESGDYI